MIQLLYLSSTRGLLGSQDLLSILSSSRRNNARDHITGILLYKSGSVIQVLEGPDDAVHALFEVIRRDPRHHRITLLYDKPILRRDFPDWTMGFRDVGDAESDANESCQAVLEGDFMDTRAGATKVRSLLAEFTLAVR